MATELIPAAPQVGGDFFFVGDGPADAVVAMIGDVVGKGLTAARRAAFTRTAFASVAPFSDDPCRILELVNAALVERIGGSADFVTAACITYHPGSGTLRAASAGHPPPLRLDTGDELRIPGSGRALGLASTVGCTAVTDELTPRRRHPPLHRQSNRSPPGNNALRGRAHSRSDPGPDRSGSA